MRFFDLHCDTIGECYKNNYSLAENDLHIDLKRTRSFEEYVQAFAIWIKDELRGEDAVDYFNNAADYFYEQLKINKETVSLYGDENKTRVKALLAVEGGSACGGTLEGLHAMINKGVRLITLTWNARNEIASGAFSEGGITEFGKEFIKTAEESGVVLDASHLNRQSFFELSEIATKPFIASHSNADIVDNSYAHKRNLTKEQILCIKDRGGLIGLNFYNAFLETEELKGTDAIANQLDYFLSLDCENILSVGSDYDGCRINTQLCGVEKIPSLYENLLLKGFDKKFLDKIFFENASRFFSEYCK